MTAPPVQIAPAPAVASGRTLAKVMQDLTVYLVGPTEDELDLLLDLYESICPSERRTLYSIAELLHWTSLSSPTFTASGRIALAEGLRRPHLEPVRQRIREDRGLELQIWDDHSLDALEGSWSFNLRRIRLKNRDAFAFVRILAPLDTAPDVLRGAAEQIANTIGLYSGHGGFTFAYDPLAKEDAFEFIYAQARRYWGIDVEDLNATLPLTHDGIKGTNWLTLVGTPMEPDGSTIQARVEHPDVTVTECTHGTLLVAGLAPAFGDQNRPDTSLVAYWSVAQALGPLFLKEHPDFAGQRFRDNANTLAWVRRFLEPEGWRP